MVEGNLSPNRWTDKKKIVIMIFLLLIQKNCNGINRILHKSYQVDMGWHQLHMREKFMYLEDL